MPKGEKTLRQFLKDDLLTQLNEIWRKGESYQDAQKGDNIQGKKHCKAVETNLDKLIPDPKKEKEFRQIDLFVLSIAACLHDIGKVVNDNTMGWKSDHGKRSMQIILDNYDELGLDRGQAIAVGYVVSAHGDGKLDELPRNPIAIGNEEINIIELAAIFRLADMLDTNYQRAPEILSKIKFPDGNIPSKWQGRQSITGWYLDEKNRIILQTIPKNNELDAAYTLKAMMTEDLSKISPYLKLYGYPSELGGLNIGDVFLKSGLKERALRQRPFPGMAYYTKDDAIIFKGRDIEIENLLANINNWPITLLIGESGAGKTSLIHAGLFPKLETMLWNFVWTRPFDNPKENIKKMIWSSFFEGEVDPSKSLLDVMRDAAEKCKPHQILIVMDQFEDILCCNVQEILDDFSLILMAVQTGTIIPNLRVLISFRDDALVKLNSRLLKRITGSALLFPSVELERLTREGAKNALLAGLENAGIGLDPRQEKGHRPLMEIILDDIQKGEDRLYPPYIQMVSETLCKNVIPSNPIITREIYLEQLKGADNIIAHYLIERLNEFGSQKDKAEKVLIFLTSSMGKKAQKSIQELSQETSIEIEELKDIINKMIDLRMARAVNDEKFEIIHDYLGKIVDEELVKGEDRTIKFSEEQLNSFYQMYKMHGTPILSPPFMASLYRNRVRIKIDEEKYPLILCTCLGKKNGLGWYWLKDTTPKKLLDIVKDFLYHGDKEKVLLAEKIFIQMIKPDDWDIIIEMMHAENNSVSNAARKAFAKIAKPEDKDKIIEMLHDKNKNVTSAAIKAFIKIAKPEDKDKIIEILHNEEEFVKMAAIGALGTRAEPEDKDLIIEMLHDKNKNVRRAACEAYKNAVRTEDKEKIIKILHDKSDYVQLAAKMAFMKIADSSDNDKIIELMQDVNKYVSNSAEEAFIRNAKYEDWDKIIDILRNRNNSIWMNYRWMSSENFLMNIVKSEDIDKLLKMLNDINENVRAAARGAVIKIAKSEDLDKVIGIMDTPLFGFGFNYDRYLAVEGVLENIAKPEDKDKLMMMLQSDNWDSSEAAKKAFAKIAKPEDKDILIEMLYDNKSALREAATKALINLTKYEDRELLDLLANESQGWGDKQSDFFKLLSILDAKIYCPYFEEIWGENRNLE